ncbi:unnamed protein product, partial [Sphacelaria rigidula]
SSKTFTDSTHRSTMVLSRFSLGALVAIGAFGASSAGSLRAGAAVSQRARVQLMETFTELGCFKDSRSRLLTNMISSSDMTPTVCAAYCTGYAIFATQYGRECWCGAAGTDVAIIGEGTCDIPCEGDSSLTCGGFYTFNAYAMPTTGPTPAPTPAPTIYPASLGCYTDKRDGRVLSNMLTSDNMTPLVCGSYCRGYAYFGTQYGSECWCGAAGTEFDKYGTSTSCTVPCAGDSSATCGGSYAFELYITPAAPSPAPSTAPTPAPTLYLDLGCFKDLRDSRVFANPLTDDSMTYAVCAAHCSAYTYFGVQYGKECWCGAAGTIFDINGSATCDIPCAGDSSAICGGTFAFNAFTVPELVPTPAPTPAPTLYPVSLGCYKDLREARVFT